jgi:hypothetical protein
MILVGAGKILPEGLRRIGGKRGSGGQQENHKQQAATIPIAAQGVGSHGFDFTN